MVSLSPHWFRHSGLLVHLFTTSPPLISLCMVFWRLQYRTSILVGAASGYWAKKWLATNTKGFPKVVTRIVEHNPVSHYPYLRLQQRALQMEALRSSPLFSRFTVVSRVKSHMILPVFFFSSFSFFASSW